MLLQTKLNETMNQESSEEKQRTSMDCITRVLNYDRKSWVKYRKDPSGQFDPRANESNEVHNPYCMTDSKCCSKEVVQGTNFCFWHLLRAGSVERYNCGCDREQYLISGDGTGRGLARQYLRNSGFPKFADSSISRDSVGFVYSCETCCEDPQYICGDLKLCKSCAGDHKDPRVIDDSESEEEKEEKFMLTSLPPGIYGIANEQGGFEVRAAHPTRGGMVIDSYEKAMIMYMLHLTNNNPVAKSWYEFARMFPDCPDYI